MLQWLLQQQEKKAQYFWRHIWWLCWIFFCHLVIYYSPASYYKKALRVVLYVCIRGVDMRVCVWTCVLYTCVCVCVVGTGDVNIRVIYKGWQRKTGTLSWPGRLLMNRGKSTEYHGQVFFKGLQIHFIPQSFLASSSALIHLWEFFSFLIKLSLFLFLTTCPWCYPLPWDENQPTNQTHTLKTSVAARRR